MIQVVLGLGSNSPYRDMGSIALLRTAYGLLTKLFIVCECSSIYRTKAMYVTDQHNFYNAAVVGNMEDSLSAEKLLDRIHCIEAALGRDRTREIRYGPRSIDIDIELFGNQYIKESDLEIPHPRLMERGFILAPMLEILRKTSDCINRDKYVAALRRLPDQGIEYVMSAADFLKEPEADYGTEYTNC